jgi:hypothetical protein
VTFVVVSSAVCLSSLVFKQKTQMKNTFVCNILGSLLLGIGQNVKFYFENLIKILTLIKAVIIIMSTYSSF